MVGGLLLGVAVKCFVVLETKLLLLHWHSHLFQSRLASHRVLGLLLLCFFVVESLGFLKVIMTFLLFHAIVWFVGLLQCAFSIVPCLFFAMVTLL